MRALVKEIFSFEDILNRYNIPVKRKEIRTLQLNIGKKCNLFCAHCHVDAGPDRTENMDKKTIERVLKLLSRNEDIHTVDITGGAPELNPNFRFLVKQLNLLNKKIIVRSNLTVFFEEGQEDTPEFLAQNRTEIFASLPCYIEENVDYQRGKNSYQKSIRALRILNNLGYGKKDSGLTLNLIYNPIGYGLPPNQIMLELEYKLYLKNIYDVEFNQLMTITNMPIKRFAKVLIRKGKFESYRHFLVEKFNSHAALNVMCQELLSVGWDGKLYDCDYNQALGIPLRTKLKTIWDISDFNVIESDISFNSHCFGCTAGSGSSCRGALT